MQYLNHAPKFRGYAECLENYEESACKTSCTPKQLTCITFLSR